MCDSSGRLVELVTLGHGPRILLELVCEPAQFGPVKTRQWLDLEKVTALLRLLGPVLEQVTRNLDIVQGLVVEGEGMRAAMVTRSVGLAVCNTGIASNRLVVRVSLVKETGGNKERKTDTEVFISHYF